MVALVGHWEGATGFTAYQGLPRSCIAHRDGVCSTGAQRPRGAHASGGRVRSEKAGALGAVPTRREPLRGTNVPGPGLASSARLHMLVPHKGRRNGMQHLQCIAAHVPLVAQGQQHATAHARVEGSLDDQLLSLSPAPGWAPGQRVRRLCRQRQGHARLVVRRPGRLVPCAVGTLGGGRLLRRGL